MNGEKDQVKEKKTAQNLDKNGAGNENDNCQEDSQNIMNKGKESEMVVDEEKSCKNHLKNGNKSESRSESEKESISKDHESKEFTSRDNSSVKSDLKQNEQDNQEIKLKEGELKEINSKEDANILSNPEEKVVDKENQDSPTPKSEKQNHEEEKLPANVINIPQLSLSTALPISGIKKVNRKERKPKRKKEKSKHKRKHKPTTEQIQAKTEKWSFEKLLSQKDLFKKTSINSLPLFSEFNSCQMCMKMIENEDCIVNLICMHIYHIDCLIKKCKK